LIEGREIEEMIRGITLAVREKKRSNSCGFFAFGTGK
jgi:hypothetical protein